MAMVEINKVAFILVVGLVGGSGVVGFCLVGGVCIFFLFFFCWGGVLGLGVFWGGGGFGIVHRLVSEIPLSPLPRSAGHFYFLSFSFSRVVSRKNRIVHMQFVRVLSSMSPRHNSFLRELPRH